jgi:hypothetical protein
LAGESGQDFLFFLIFSGIVESGGMGQENEGRQSTNLANAITGLAAVIDTASVRLRQQLAHLRRQLHRRSVAPRMQEVEFLPANVQDKRLDLEALSRLIDAAEFVTLLCAESFKTLHVGLGT